MSLFLSKILPLFVYPVGFCIVLAVFAGVASWAGHKGLARVLFVVSLAVLWVSATPLVAGYLYGSLEREYPPVAVEDSPRADAIVVLGGALGSAAPPRLSAELVGASDRILHATRLYRAGKAPVVVAVGGAISWMGTATPEAFPMASLLQEWGVAKNAIVLETGSRNTYENALGTKRLLAEHGLKSVLLVTSAAHMPRALAVFRTAGIEAIPSPTDFEVVDHARSLMDWLPSAGALNGSTLAMKEYLGIAVYWWRGWI